MSITYSHNPHPIWTTAWYVHKERHDNWVPYHIGSTPSGKPCPTMPRVQLVRDGVYRCPACGKEFPTFTAEAQRLGLEIP